MNSITAWRGVGLQQLPLLDRRKGAAVFLQRPQAFEGREMLSGRIALVARETILGVAFVQRDHLGVARHLGIRLPSTSRYSAVTGKASMARRMARCVA